MAKSIMDFYTPSFREDFSQWLESIPEYPKPYEFTLGKVSQLLNMNPDSFFSSEDSNSGCFSLSEDLKFDDKKNMTYYETDIKVNGSKVGTERHYCIFGTSKQLFLKSFTAKRLALERAENVYLSEAVSYQNYMK